MLRWARNGDRSNIPVKTADQRLRSAQDPIRRRLNRGSDASLSDVRTPASRDPGIRRLRHVIKRRNGSRVACGRL
jgi:hypothetical protein